VFDPALLLLDEPLSALDKKLRAELQEELRALHRRVGRTFINVTHDQEEALSISERIVVMNAGRIEQIGTPETVYRNPASAFVASFVGRSGSFDATVEPLGRLRAGNMSLGADAVASLPAGAVARAFIRPEDVKLGPAAEAYPGAVMAIVGGVVFLGPVCRIHLLVEGVTLEADVASDQMAGLNLANSARVLVAVPADKVMAYPHG
jgi:iron(III) transport system ATP-binding protein